MVLSGQSQHGGLTDPCLERAEANAYGKGGEVNRGVKKEIPITVSRWAGASSRDECRHVRLGEEGRERGGG